MKNRKGFTMVELLAVIVIVGALSVIAIVGVSRYISSARDEKKNQDRDNIAMAARLYMQANRDLLPRTIGDNAVVQVSELRRANYLKEDVTDKNGKSCMEKSFVRVYKLDEQDYSYSTYLYCGDETVPDEIVPPKPEIVNFKFNGYGNGSNFTNVKSATFSFRINGATDDGTVGIYSYSYSIFAKKNDDAGFTEVFYSGDLKAGYEPVVEVKSKTLSTYFDVTGYNSIRINITAVNEQGGKVEFSSTAGGFKDTDNPICGLISGQAANDDDWVNKATFNSGAYKNNFRRISVACSDGDGSGCKRETFTTSWPNDTDTSASGIDYSYGARWSYIVLEDNAQNTNKTTCYVRTNVDVDSPKVTVTVYKAKQDGSRGAKVATKVVEDDHKRTATLPSGTIKSTDYTDLVGTSSEKWMNLANYPYGVIIDVDITDNLYLYSYEWSVNNPYVEGGSNNNTIIGSASTANATVEQRGGTAVTGIFASTGMTDNPKNNDELKTAEHGALSGNIKGLLLHREGKRYGKLVVCDKARNCTTVNIYADIDRTPPLVPRTSYAKLTTNASYTPANESDYTQTTKWSNEYLRAYIEGQREDRQTQEEGVNATLSGWDHFTYSYRKQTGKNNSGLTWANATTGDVFHAFSGTSRYGFDIKDQGTHIVTFRSCDKAGNCSDYGINDYPKVDTIAPTCGVVTTYHGTTGPNAAGWLKIGESATLSHSCADEDAKFSSGCNPNDFHNQQTYTFNSDINTTKAGANGYETKYGPNDNSAGGHVVDYAGNISNECPKTTLKIDHIPPTCKTVIKWPEGDPLHPTDASKKETGWLGLVNGIGPSKKSAVVSLSCTDPTSTSANGLMPNIKSDCWNDHEYNKQSHIYNTEMNITNAGAVGAGQGGQVVDIAGNITPCPADRTVKIDYTKPVCTTILDYGTGAGASAFTKINSDPKSSFGWIGFLDNTSNNKEMARVTQHCEDSNGSQKSGCYGTMLFKIYDYDLNTTQAGAKGVGDNGTIVDTAGNITDCSTNGNWKTVKADYVRPVCSVTATSSGSGNGNNWAHNPYNGEWVGKNAVVTVAATCTSAESGTGVSSGCNTNLSHKYSTEISTETATAQGDNKQVYVYDKADNRSTECAKKTVRIDTTGPTCAVTSTYDNGKPYNGDWVKGTFAVRVSSQCTGDKLGSGAAGSGCSETAVHNHDFTTAEGTILVTNGGSSSNGGAYVIKDTVGNTTTCATVPIKIDYQPPLCPIVAKTQSGKDYKSGVWVNEGVVVSRSCNDRQGSGCSPYMRLESTGTACANGSDDLTNSHTYNVSGENLATFNGAGADGVGCEVRIQDNVGNSTVCAANLTVKIDKEPPTCTVSTTNVGDWTNQTATIQGNCTDEGSGCKTTAAELKVSFSTDTDQSYNYSKPLVDNAGNTSTCEGDKSYTIKVDKTPPSCTMRKEPPSSAVDVLYGQALPNENGVDLYVDCSASGAPLTLCGKYACSNRGIIQYTNSGLWRAKTTSAPAATVRDAAGNSSTCTVTIYSKTQNRSATCSSCKSCSSAGCRLYSYCANSACGTYIVRYDGVGRCYPSAGRKPRRVSGTGKTYDDCENNVFSKCTNKERAEAVCSGVKANKSCRTSGCGCDSYYSNCASCGCNSLGSYSGWYDGSTTAGWHGNYHYQKRTVYY